MLETLSKTMKALRLIQKKKKYGRVRYRMNPWNPLTYVWMLLVALAIFAFGGYSDVVEFWREIKPFSWGD